ncbi:hypothetical protein ACGFIP_10795 [Micromonospora zamorensis]|uniref:hypothetical protein n=1 Tax=Micromonospora zamorensis TaxID=709883 RepID=UPI00371B7830
MSASTTAIRIPRVPVHPLPGPIARWGLVFLAAALTACTPAGDSRQPSAPPPNGAAASTSTSGGGSPCTPSVTEMSAPPAGYRLVGEDVAVPGAAVLFAEESGEADPAARLFAKWGLVVRAGRVVDLRVAPGWEGRARVGWGATTPAATATVHACAAEGGQAQWLAFVGGTWVARASCVPVIVTSNGQDHRVDLGIGVACATTTP